MKVGVSCTIQKENFIECNLVESKEIESSESENTETMKTILTAPF
jgi:hypothetical protein